MAGKAQARGEKPLEDLLQKAIDSDENGEVSVGSLLDAFGSRSFGPVIALASLVAIVPPIGAIPTVPTSVGVITFPLAIQLVFGRKHPWIPGFIRRRGVDKAKFEAVQRKTKGALE